MSNEGNIYILAGPGKIKITHNVLSVSPKLSYLSIYFVGVYIMSSSGQISMPIVNSASCPSGYFIALTSKSIYSYTLPIKYDIGTLNITSEKVTQTIKKQDGTTVDVDVTNTYSPYTSSFHENCMTGLYVNQNTFIKNIDPSDILCINYGSNYWVNPMLLNSTETNITNPSGLSSSNYNILKNWNDYIDARKNFAVSASLGYGLYKDVSVIKKTISNITANGVESAQTAKRLENSVNIWGHEFDGEYDIDGDLSSVGSISMNGTITGCIDINKINSSINGIYTSIDNINAHSGSSDTAKQLATSHNIWGQPFNGTNDVSGNLTSVKDINMTGDIIGSNTISKINTSIIDLYSKIGTETSNGTSLKTGLTVWGKTFNGQDDITGDLSSVGNISMNGTITGCTDITKIDTSISDLYNKVNTIQGGGTVLKDGLTLWGKPFNGTSSVDGGLINVKDISMNGEIIGSTTITKIDTSISDLYNKVNTIQGGGTVLKDGLTLWGQPFNGTSSVDGSLINVKDISMNGDITGCGTLNSQYIKLAKEFLAGTKDSDDFTSILKGTIITKNLTVTGIAHFFELVIDKLKSVGGSVILTPANGFVVDIVETDSYGNYILYFLAENDGKKISNEWQVGDQAVCQSFNDATEGTSYNVSTKKYWSAVIAVDSDVVVKNGKNYHYITISITNYSTDFGVPNPAVGDNIVMLGNQESPTTDMSRKSAIYIAAYSSLDAGITAPLIATYRGINNFDLSSHRKTYIDAAGAQFIGKFTAVSGEDLEDMINAKDSSTILYAHYAYCTDITTDTTGNNTYSGFEKAVIGKTYTGYKYMGLCSNHIESDSALTADSYSWSQILYDTSTLKAPDQYTLIDQGTEAYAYINDSAELNTKIILYYSIEYNNGHTLTILSSLPSGYTLEWYYSENPSSTHTNIPYESSHTGWYYSIADSYNKSYNFITVRLIYTNTNNNVTTTTVIKSVIVPIILKSQAALTITDEIKMMATSNSSSYNALNSSILSNIQRIGSLEVSSTQIQSKLTADETKINTIDGSIVEISNSYSTITQTINDINAKVEKQTTNLNSSFGYVNDKFASIDTSLNGISMTVSNVSNYVNGTITNKISEISTKVDSINLSVKDVQVGGVNILNGTDFTKINSTNKNLYWENFYYDSFLEGPITNTYSLTLSNASITSTYLDAISQSIEGKLLNSTWYTLSFYSYSGSKFSTFIYSSSAKTASENVGNTETGVSFIIDGQSSSSAVDCYHLWNDASNTGWTKHTYTFKTSASFSSTDSLHFLIRLTKSDNSVITGISQIQLEEGTIATAWRPSAHDYESGIDITATSITSYVNDVSSRLNSSIIQTANSITSYVNDVSAGLTSNITQLSNKIALSAKQVGGKNLLKSTDFTKVISMTGTNFWNIFNYTDGFTEGPSKDSSALIANNNTSYEKEILKQSIDGILMPSSFYTLSFYSYGGSKFYTYIYDEYANTTNENVGDTYVNTIIDGQEFKQSADCGHLWDDSSETGWKKHTYIFKTQSTIKDTNEKIYFLVRLDDSTEKITGISKIQLEEGTTDTTWSPSSHDYESELDITADSITGKVMDLSSGVYTKIQQTSKEISLTVEESKIGGRNLMSNSDFNNGMENWNINNTGTSNVNGYLTESNLPTGISHGIVINVEDKENGLYTSFLNNKLNKDAQYTISFYGKVDSGSCDMYFGYEKVSTTNVSLSTTWQRFHMTFTYDGNNKSIVFYPTASCIFYITGVMIEEGNMMSSWCLSALEINNINVTNKLLSTGIDIKNKIITATTDNFKIKNNSGDTTFYVDVSGNLIGSGNASFKGDIYATNGTFSGIINAGQSIINGNINLYSTNNGGISVYDSNNIEKILITPSSMSTYSDIFTGTATSYTHSINLADNINTEIHTVNSTIQGGIQTLGTFNNGDVLQFSKLTLNVNIDGIIDSNFNLYPHLTLYRENDSNYSTEIFSDTSSVSGVTDVNYNDKDITISTDGTYYLKLSMTIICGDYNNEYGKHPYISYSCLLNIQKIVGILNNKTIIAQDGLMVGFTNTSWLFANTKEIEIRWNNHGLKLSDDGFQQLYNSTTWGPFMCYRNIKDITELSLTSNGGYSVSTTDETLVLYSTSSDNTHKIFITEDNQINGRVITIMDKTSSTTYVKFYTSYLKANQNTKTTGSTTWELTDSAVHKITFVTNIGWIEEYMG